ncbi:CP2 transcription factor-domain-containing protein [Xylaria bambusicola]|uniref:CP2 transcription factor-domain-containing protein n=1 Tax=Xylaria bambusicola TaxID=326684 RepID=UPI002007B5A2|nr:CP2 transcription factor-domain-containing protein [Xylaria bambusicola]KAI0509489.1 CP2 transcription factor-domain-containing protein [Xylaria bambusicola]
MFRQRTSSQKPDDALLANFRQQFPNIGAPGTASSAAASHPPLALDNHATGQLPTAERHHVGPEAFRDQDPTPRASGPEWRYTPSLFNPNSFTFDAFANQPPGYYTPTPGGTNTLYHHQAGDLHTPMGMGLSTPLSLPTNDGTIHAGPSGMLEIPHFHQPSIAPQQFHHGPFNPFIQPVSQQPTFAPSSFTQHDTGYETMDHDASTLGTEGRVERIGSMDAAFHPQSPSMLNLQSGRYQMGMPGMPGMSILLPPNATKFRFLCTLHAATAMIKNADEIPVTYLNKGQVYQFTVKDTISPLPAVPGTKYRTFIRISFEDEQQRQKPEACWTLWKDGRGMNEAHQRNGKLQAVEYVESGQPPVEGDDQRTRIELESSSFDGFCVTWTPGANGPAECAISVRFNFLSTDFSHSKGVKGIPVRLCAKTSVASTAESPPPDDPVFEICYCKVKLFRDHGAERKLTNDVQHVKKAIEKLRAQLFQAETGGKDYAKRKRGGGQGKSQDHQRPGKAPKHKRTWSMSSASSADGGSGGNARSSQEADMHIKLTTLQDMFGSSRAVSILYLRGEDLDDPDRHPVALSGELPDLSREDSKEGIAWRNRSARNSITGSSLVSPSPSSTSLHSQATGTGQWAERQGAGSSHRMSDQATRVPTKTDDDGNLSCWIEALGVDPSYKPPNEKTAKSIACFYIAKKPTANSDKRELHKAVYLTERTLSDFISRVTTKWSLDPTRITRVIHLYEGSLEVEMDDDVIRELSEGQAMVLDVVEVDLNVPQTKAGWDIMSIDIPEPDRNSAHSAYRTTTGYELRFHF